jgi:hypothetical protein
MRLGKISMVLASCTISNYAFAMQSTEEESHVKQAIIMAKKDFEICKNEKDLASFLSSYFDLTNTINILDDEIDYDKDKLEHLRKKTALNIAKIDKKVGRIILEYEDGFSFGTGSFVNKKIVTNAHVLDGFPKTTGLFFEQGRSLVLPEKFDVEAIAAGLNKNKSSFLNYKLYEESKTELEALLPSSVLSKYEAKETVNVLENYFYDIKNSDIGYVDDYAPCEGCEDFSDHSFNYVPENDFLLSSPLQKQQSQKVFKLTHYPLGIPLQRTSYGLLDYKTQRHRINTLGGSSGSLILNYDSQPEGMHSCAISPYYNKMEYSVSETFNIYQNLNSFGKESVYLKLNKGFSHRVLSSFNSKKIKRVLLKVLPMAKKTIKI